MAEKPRAEEFSDKQTEAERTKEELDRKAKASAIAALSKPRPMPF
jgi:hypothetical protein